MDPNAPQQPAQEQTPAPQAPMQQPMTPNYDLTISAVFKNCWDYFTSNLGLYLGLYAVTIGLSLLVYIPLFIFMFSGSGAEFDSQGNLTSVDESQFNIGAFILTIVVTFMAIIVVTARVLASTIAASLKIIEENKSVTFGEAWALGKPHLKNVVLVTLVMGLVVVLGFIAFIIPGILAILFYFVATSAAVDKNLGVSGSLNESARLTKGRRGFILGLIVVLMLVNIVLSVIPVIGQIANIVLGIVFQIVPIYVYVALKHEKGGGGLHAGAQTGMPVTPPPGQGMPAPGTPAPTPTAPEAPPVSQPETPAPNPPEQQPPAAQ